MREARNRSDFVPLITAKKQSGPGPSGDYRERVPPPIGRRQYLWKQKALDGVALFRRDDEMSSTVLLPAVLIHLPAKRRFLALADDGDA